MLKQIRKDIYLQAVLIGLIAVNLMFTVTLGATGAQDETPVINNTDLASGKELFVKARKMFYNAEAPVNEVVKNLEGSNESFAKLPESFEKYYWKANVAYLSGEMAEVAGDKQKAAADFAMSNELIRKALNYNSKSSEANRVMADTIMRLMSYKGTVYKITQEPQANKLLNKALDLDEENYAAMNSLGMYYINAPAIGGGSVDKGIEVLIKALKSKDKFDNFVSNVWLGNAFQKKKSFDESIKFYHKALQIYPNSPWVRSLLTEIE